jgi:hypothetical protein
MLSQFSGQGGLALLSIMTGMAQNDPALMSLFNRINSAGAPVAANKQVSANTPMVNKQQSIQQPSGLQNLTTQLNQQVQQSPLTMSPNTYQSWGGGIKGGNSPNPMARYAQ